MALQVDSHLEVIPLVFEEPHSYVMSYEVEHMTNGVVVGELDRPADSSREVFHFRGISSANPIAPTPGIKALMSYYLSGGELRVFRNYPANLTEWSVSNEFGYSDVVQMEVGDAEFPWYNQGMTVFSFDIDGVRV